MLRKQQIFLLTLMIFLCGCGGGRDDGGLPVVENQEDTPLVEDADPPDWTIADFAPEAVLLVNPFSSGAAPFLLTLDASESNDPDGQIAAYEWQLDGSRLSEEPVVDLTLTLPGEYTVTLTVTDDDGLFDIARQVVIVTEDLEGITIIGDEMFARQTRDALTLLQNHAADAYMRMKTHMSVIKQGERSGVWLNENPAVFEVGESTWSYSTTWYAGAIAHDATHAVLYQTYANLYGEPVPFDIWGSQEAEMECIEFQIDVMERIAAPEEEMAMLMRLDGTHCDVDHNGVCDYEDYLARNW